MFDEKVVRAVLQEISFFVDEKDDDDVHCYWGSLKIINFCFVVGERKEGGGFCLFFERHGPSSAFENAETKLILVAQKLMMNGIFAFFCVSERT